MAKGMHANTPSLHSWKLSTRAARVHLPRHNSRFKDIPRPDSRFKDINEDRCDRVMHARCDGMTYLPEMTRMAFWRRSGGVCWTRSQLKMAPLCALIMVEENPDSVFLSLPRTYRARAQTT